VRWASVQAVDVKSQNLTHQISLKSVNLQNNKVDVFLDTVYIVYLYSHSPFQFLQASDVSNNVNSYHAISTLV